jgi:dihydroorotase
MQDDDMAFELVLSGARVLDPSQNIDKVIDVAFAGGKVAAIGDDLASDAAIVKDCAGAIVTPGLIDLHTHVYDGGTSLGVDPLALTTTGGVTTLVDAGSAGPGNFAGFRAHVIEPAPVRILAYLNISFAGIYAFSKRVMVGESGDQRLLSPIDAVEVANAHRDVLAGIKVRVGRNASGTSGIVPLDIAREVAEELGMPMMVHIDLPPPTLEEVLQRLRPGDVLTHCFRPFPNSPVLAGRIRSEVIAARERGVLFDIGHGMGSFSFDVARTMLAGGFMPDTISSDVHALCIEGPAFDLITTMSKFLCLGVPLDAVVRAATVNVASALQRPELGSLRPGSAGDASIIAVENGAFDYADSTGATLRGEQKIVARDVVIGGRLWSDRLTS